MASLTQIDADVILISTREMRRACGNNGANVFTEIVKEGGFVYACQHTKCIIMKSMENCICDMGFRQPVAHAESIPSKEVFA